MFFLSTWATSRRNREASPGWRRRCRRARHQARRRCRAGKGTASDFLLLASHHGSMPAKSKENEKQGSKGQDAGPTTKLEFGYPAELTTALKAISDRATQDLWNTTVPQGGDPTAEQVAQRHANLVHRLSKRVAGDIKLKHALKTARSQWALTLGHHLSQLVPRP